jgi:hypothetical protein
MATHAWVISTFTVPTQYSHKMLWLHILGWFEPPQFLHSTATKCYGYTYLGDLNLHSSYTGQPQNVMVTHTWVISTFTVPTEDSHRMLWLHMLWWFELSQYSHKNVMVTHTWVIWNFTVPTQYSHKMLWLHILGWYQPSQFLHSTATKCYSHTCFGDLNLHLFGFTTFRLWSCPMKVIPTRRAH